MESIGHSSNTQLKKWLLQHEHSEGSSPRTISLLKFMSPKAKYFLWSHCTMARDMLKQTYHQEQNFSVTELDVIRGQWIGALVGCKGHK